MVVLVTCKNEDPSKMKALEWSQHFSHYKYMGNFPTPGQLTLQPKNWSGQILNPSEALWLTLLSARMKKVQSKDMALE